MHDVQYEFNFANDPAAVSVPMSENEVSEAKNRDLIG